MLKSYKDFWVWLIYLGKYVKKLSFETTNLRMLFKKKKKIPWQWGPNHEQEFLNLKNLISSAPVLTYFDPNKPLSLSVDASSESLGAVISHNNQPIAYASSL